MKNPLLKLFHSKSTITPVDIHPQTADRESISIQFYEANKRVLEPLNHLIIAPKQSEYGDVQEYKKAFDITMQAISEIKNFCSKSEAGLIWYEDYYCHCFNSRQKDFNLIEQIEQQYYDFLSNYESVQSKMEKKKAATEYLLANGSYIRRTIIQLIQSEPGILQKSIYSNFDPEYKTVVIQVLQNLIKEKIIFREKEGNSFRLYLKPQITTHTIDVLST